MRFFATLASFALVAFPAFASAAPPATASAQATPPGATAIGTLEAPAADKTFTIGTLRVQQYGDHGRALILIPGLKGGSWVWRNTIQHFRGNHKIYAVTLAGFDGLPPPAKPMMGLPCGPGGRFVFMMPLF